MHNIRRCEAARWQMRLTCCLGHGQLEQRRNQSGGKDQCPNAADTC
jgi:hypothetical protein